MQNARPTLPTIDIESSEQNAFVQTWLERYNKHTRPLDIDRAEDQDIAFEQVIEAVQETYNYKEDPNAKS